MRGSRGIGGSGCLPGRLLAAGLVFGVIAGAAAAEDRYVVGRDGSKVRVVRSQSELAVTFKETEDAKTEDIRMAKSGTGSVKDIPWAPDSPIKILRVGDASTAKRYAVGNDLAIDKVYPVYHYIGNDAPVISTGTIALRLRPNQPDGALQELLDNYLLDLVEPIDGLDRTYLVRPSEEMGDEVLRAEALAVDHRVLWARPNFRNPVYFAQVSPSDTYYSQQWHLNNTGQLGGTANADVNAPEAWLLGAEGQDVLIGMLDDACDVDHPDLIANYHLPGHDPTLQSTADGFDDPRPKVVGDRHGTAVMGLAVGRANTQGIRGVSYLSQFTASRGLGQALTDAQISNAYLFARQQNVDVHINSWGLGGGVPIPPIIEDALETAFIEGRDLDGETGNQPPRGMVVVFASGNGTHNDGVGVQLSFGDELATLPTVIGVGATNDHDQLTSYSNYGREIDVLAPGGGEFSGITTTDVNDAAGYIDDGFNVQGINVDGAADVDSAGLYTEMFQGTSAACPIAAGVAALTLSINPFLTSTDVRLILEHTAAQVSQADAAYDKVTGRSLKYGYGRIDAEAAAEAATDSLANGGHTWPERPADVNISTELGQITWVQNGDPLEFRETEDNTDPDTGQDIQVLRTTDEFLVLESEAPFDFTPVDGLCYHQDQLGCGSTALADLPNNVNILTVGCSLTCGSGSTGACEAGAAQCVGFLQPSGKKYFAIFARSVIGRYSFGVRVDTDGNILDGGHLPPRATASSSTGGGGGTTTSTGPTVSIDYSPRSGVSPLTVSFRGNASSALPIDDSRTVWDFDIDDGVTVDATTRTASYKYELQPGETSTNQKTFIARLTMFDVEGNIGFAQAAVSVTAAGVDPNTGADSAAELRIVVAIPGSAGSDIDTGTSPLQVELSIDATSLTGTVDSVFWDLGDGVTTSSRFVSHTYVNNTGVTLRIPITATVRIISGNDTITKIVSRRLSVAPGDSSGDTTDVSCGIEDGCGATGPGGEATPCGVIGMVPLLFLTFTLCLLRRGSNFRRIER